jgi:hypothetical protein
MEGMMAQIGVRQLEKIAKAVGELIGHPLKLRMGGAADNYRMEVVNESGVQLVPTNTPTWTAGYLSIWLRGYMYARVYERLEAKHGFQTDCYDAKRPTPVEAMLANMQN